VKGLDMPTTDETPPPNLPPSSLPYNPKLARKDAEIGDFYMQSGNWRGAYERFIEANRSDPGNPEAVFGLAESARRLSHMDEALRNYRLYLSALPNGPHAKEVRKALKEMGAAPPA
jgi:tetratricopeptide (TPR) repeat protein